MVDTQVLILRGHGDDYMIDFPFSILFNGNFLLAFLLQSVFLADFFIGISKVQSSF